jgi:hypothetical protein
MRMVRRVRSAKQTSVAARLGVAVPKQAAPVRVEIEPRPRWRALPEFGWLSPLSPRTRGFPRVGSLNSPRLWKSVSVAFARLLPGESYLQPVTAPKEH